ncbi:MAG: HAD-IIB family hydrolase [Vulcanimicrobiaceae bacterium]
MMYILLLSVHGLIRSHDLELGANADTGGQTSYVVELARALGRHTEIGRVDLVTRLIRDPRYSPDYAVPEESLGGSARIVRLPFGPARYLRKELLWDHLDALVDSCLHFLKRQGRIPDAIHAHYADAGYVGTHLSRLLGVPLIFTGHSLGRVKRERLLASSRSVDAIERQFNLARRVSAEEETLETARLVIASTRQEIEHQYGVYEHFELRRSIVIPPGVDVARFVSKPRSRPAPRIRELLSRFLCDPGKPAILGIARPAQIKNLSALVRAFGGESRLRDVANLVLIAGNRSDIMTMEENERTELTKLLFAIDLYDLYGHVAIPKQHAADDVPEFMRYAAVTRGVFVNPALNENFGLTLLEAAASGLPVVATNSGGPVEIVAQCRNGLLVDPLDTGAIAAAIGTVLSDKRRWAAWARQGIAGVARHYTWEGHVRTYLSAVKRVVRRGAKHRRRTLGLALHHQVNPLPIAQRVLVSDLDNTLCGSPDAWRRLLTWLEENRAHTAFAIATGRSLKGAFRFLKDLQLPLPAVLIAAVGTEIYYGPNMEPDGGWRRFVSHDWRRQEVLDALKGVPGMGLQNRANQRDFKISYSVDPSRGFTLAAAQRRLRERRLRASLVYSHGRYLDVLPVRASKGLAIRYLSYRWDLPLDRFLVAGDSGNDIEMIRGESLGIVVGDCQPEMESLRGQHRVYFAEQPGLLGILEGIEHYDRARRSSPELALH